jgi:hypothetical protein
MCFDSSFYLLFFALFLAFFTVDSGKEIIKSLVVLSVSFG